VRMLFGKCAGQLTHNLYIYKDHNMDIYPSKLPDCLGGVECTAYYRMRLRTCGRHYAHHYALLEYGIPCSRPPFHKNREKRLLIYCRFTCTHHSGRRRSQHPRTPSLPAPHTCSSVPGHGDRLA